MTCINLNSITNNYFHNSRNPKKMSEAINDMYAFTNLTDSVIGRIRSTPSEDLKEVCCFYWKKEIMFFYKF